MDTIEFEKKVAIDILQELYDYAMKDPKIMVVNWLAFLLLCVCSELFIVSHKECYSIENYFNGSHKVHHWESFIKETEWWKELELLHDFHWQLSNLPSKQDEYAPYLSKDKLTLPHYTLGDI